MKTFRVQKSFVVSMVVDIKAKSENEAISISENDKQFDVFDDAYENIYKNYDLNIAENPTEVLEN